MYEVICPFRSVNETRLPSAIRVVLIIGSLPERKRFGLYAAKAVNRDVYHVSLLICYICEIDARVVEAKDSRW